LQWADPSRGAGIWPQLQPQYPRDKALQQFQKSVHVFAVSADQEDCQ
jgi:hypothetical protein